MSINIIHNKSSNFFLISHFLRFLWLVSIYRFSWICSTNTIILFFTSLIVVSIKWILRFINISSSVVLWRLPINCRYIALLHIFVTLSFEILLFVFMKPSVMWLCHYRCPAIFNFIYRGDHHTTYNLLFVLDVR